jgi:hypothetical protein
VVAKPSSVPGKKQLHKIIPLFKALASVNYAMIALVLAGSKKRELGVRFDNQRFPSERFSLKPGPKDQAVGRASGSNQFVEGRTSKLLFDLFLVGRRSWQESGVLLLNGLPHACRRFAHSFLGNQLARHRGEYVIIVFDTLQALVRKLAHHGQ